MLVSLPVSTQRSQAMIPPSALCTSSVHRSFRRHPRPTAAGYSSGAQLSALQQCSQQLHVAERSSTRTLTVHMHLNGITSADLHASSRARDVGGWLPGRGGRHAVERCSTASVRAVGSHKSLPSGCCCGGALAHNKEHTWVPGLGCPFPPSWPGGGGGVCARCIPWLTSIRTHMLPAATPPSPVDECRHHHA